jgi:hypothetical protein
MVICFDLMSCENKPLVRWFWCIRCSLFIRGVNNIEAVNPYRLPVSLFGDLLTSRRCNISCFIFKSGPFHFGNIIRGFQNVAVNANQNAVSRF